MHSLLVEMAPGGIPKEINASDVDAFLAQLSPTSPVEQIRFDLTVELLDQHPTPRCPTQGVSQNGSALQSPRRRRRCRTCSASGPSWPPCSSATPATSARFRTRDHFAAYNGTAPVEFSSAGRTVHRVSTRGNRQLNHAIHMTAISQIVTLARTVGSSSTARSLKARRNEKRSGR